MWRPWSPVLVVPLGLVLSSCGGSAAGGLGAPCVSNADCRPPLVCDPGSSTCRAANEGTADASIDGPEIDAAQGIDAAPTDAASIDGASIDAASIDGPEIDAAQGIDAAPTDAASIDAAPSSSGIELIAGGLGGAGNIDGVGDLARFHDPKRLLYDGAGNVYMTEDYLVGSGPYSGDIRRFEVATGRATTIAQSTPASPWSGGSIAMGEPGTLYASLNRRVYRIDLTTLNRTDTGLVASAIASDGAGHLFLGEGPRVSKVDLATNQGTLLTTLDYSGVPPYRIYSNAADLHFVGGYLYVADSTEFVVHKVDPNTGAATVLAGTAWTQGGADGIGTNAVFWSPNCLASDGGANLFVCDGDPSQAQRLRKIVLATAEVTMVGIVGQSVATDGTNFWRAPGDFFPYVDHRNVLEQFSVPALLQSQYTIIAGKLPEAGDVDAVAAAARFGTSTRVISDGAGGVFVADGPNGIRHVDLATAAVTTVANGGTEIDQYGPRDIALDGAGNLFFTDPTRCTVGRVHLASGQVSTVLGTPGWCAYPIDANGLNSKFKYPLAMTNDGLGHLIISDSGTLRRVDLATLDVVTFAGFLYATSDVDGVGTNASFCVIMSLAPDGAGNLFVGERACMGGGAIRKVVLSTAEVTTLVTNADLSMGTWTNDGLWGIAYDGAGHIYEADGDNHVIRRIDTATRQVTVAVGTFGLAGVRLGSLPGSLSSPSSVLVDSDGSLIVSDFGEHAILRVRW